MKWWRHLFLGILYLFVISPVLGQPVYSDIIERPNFGTFCEGSEFSIDENHFSTYQLMGSCGDQLLSLEDRSDDIKIEGARPIERLLSQQIGVVKFMSFKFKAEKGVEEIRITRRSIVDLRDGQSCQPPEEGYILERIYVYTFKVVPAPPTPKLDLERYISTSTIKFRASGCPTAGGEVDYVWNATICLEDANTVFEKGDKDGKREGFGGVYYRVACRDISGCIGKPTDFERGITYNPPGVDCIPDIARQDIEEIESIRRPADPNSPDYDTYHKYPVEKKVCDFSNPACTAANIFNLMISENQFITPIPADLPGIDLFNVDEKYAPKHKPVESCGILNLPALAGEALLRLTQYPPQIGLLNPAMTYIDRANYVTINYTLKKHIFFPGRVIRKIMQRCDGIYSLTIGEGMNNNAFGSPLTDANVFWGKKIFQNADERLRLKFEEIY